MLAAEIDAGVEPGLGVDRRYERSGIEIRGCRRLLGGGNTANLVRIPVFHHTEAAELALVAVEIAVVIAVAGDEAAAADAVVGLDALDHMDRERQSRDPRFAILLVL